MALPPQKPEQLLLYLGMTMDDIGNESEPSNASKRQRLAQPDRANGTAASAGGSTPRRRATMVDTSGDGRADTLVVDTTGDGIPDRACSSYGVDTTGDGKTDALLADTNGDGQPDSLVYDTTGDGLPDTVVPAVIMDMTGDGEPDVALVNGEDDSHDQPIISIYGREHPGQKVGVNIATRNLAAMGSASGVTLGGSSASVAMHNVAPIVNNLSSPHALPCVQPEEPTGKKARASSSGCGKQGWTQEEDEHICNTVAAIGTKWSKVAEGLPGRTDDAVRNRYLRLKKKLPTNGGGLHPAEVSSCGSTKKGDMWTQEEDKTICDSVDELGQKWGYVAERLPGRSANAIRNRYLRVLRPHEATRAQQPARRASSTGSTAADAAAMVAVAAAAAAVAHPPPSHPAVLAAAST